MVRDYLGPVVNCTARLQGLADAGTILVDWTVAAALEDASLIDRTEEFAERIESLKGVDPDNVQLFEVPGPH